VNTVDMFARPSATLILAFLATVDADSDVLITRYNSSAKGFQRISKLATYVEKYHFHL